MSTQEPEVDNPYYTDLVALRAEVRRVAGTLGAALDTAAMSMGGGHVWSGPTARGWQQELNGHKGTLSRAAAQLEADVDEALKGVDPKVPASTASKIRKERQFR